MSPSHIGLGGGVSAYWCGLGYSPDWIEAWDEHPWLSLDFGNGDREWRPRDSLDCASTEDGRPQLVLGLEMEQIGLIWGTHQAGLVQLDDSVQTWRLRMVRQPGLVLGVGTSQVDRVGSHATQPGQHEITRLRPGVWEMDKVILVKSHGGLWNIFYYSRGSL